MFESPCGGTWARRDHLSLLFLAETLQSPCPVRAWLRGQDLGTFPLGEQRARLPMACVRAGSVRLMEDQASPMTWLVWI